LIYTPSRRTIGFRIGSNGLIRIFLPLALGLAVLAAPASAADLATIGCVGDKIDDGVRARVVQDVERNLGLIGQRSSYSPEVVQAMKDAGTACATEHGWSAPAVRLAILYALARLSLPVVQRVAGERGHDPAGLEALFQALPEERRNKPLTNEDYRALADAAIPEGEGRTREAGALLRTFFEFQSILQYASTDFAAA
jgi:hypothetical protein